MEIEVEITSAKGNMAVDVKACQDGTFRCTYQAERAGFYRVEISSGGVVVGSPVQL